MIKSISIKLIGKVQGVGFRFYTQKTARELGVRGFVKNERDGSVYIEAEAENGIMDAFTEWVKKGPQWARVDKLAIQDKAVEGFTGFEIR